MSEGEKYIRRAKVLVAISPAICGILWLLNAIYGLRFESNTSFWIHFMHIINCILYVAQFLPFSCIGISIAGAKFAYEARRMNAPHAKLVYIIAIIEIVLTIAYGFLMFMYLSMYRSVPPWEMDKLL